MLGLLPLLLLALWLFAQWSSRWGATDEEVHQTMPGDEYLADRSERRVVMTRAINLNAEPQVVWPWLAQLGRGAGYYSFDLLDNGGKASARHIVGWIPPPRLGDAAAIGYLRHLEPERALVWWVKGLTWMGATARMVIDIRLTPTPAGSRLVIRITGQAGGLTAALALGLFQLIDGIMATRQLLGIKQSVERYGARTSDPERPETGQRDQYQLFETIYACGERCGVAGKEDAARWRQAALEDGVL